MVIYDDRRDFSVGVSINGGTQQWMVDFMEHAIYKWMTGGTPMTKRKPPIGETLWKDLKGRDKQLQQLHFDPKSLSDFVEQALLGHET